MGLGVIARACAAVYLVVISYAQLALYVQHGTVKKDRLLEVFNITSESCEDVNRGSEPAYPWPIRGRTPNTGGSASSEDYGECDTWRARRGQRQQDTPGKRR